MKLRPLGGTLVLGAGQLAAGRVFGPGGCVSLSQSSAGSCVLATNCEGHDTSTFEFVFDCLAKDKATLRHSFGKGGFDANEEYDTGVVCDRCEIPPYLLPQPAAKTPPTVPAPKAAVAASAPAQRTSLLARSALAKQTAQAVNATPTTAPDVLGSVKGWFQPKAAPLQTPPPPPPVYYGPNKCVATYLSEAGHCIMQTKCTAADIKGYSFGLVCVDKKGEPVRHLFGKDSFDPHETFDTLITCDQCLGLEDIPEDVAVNGQVAVLTQQLAAMKSMMSNLTQQVALLSKRVVVDEERGTQHVSDASVEQMAAPGPAWAPAPAPSLLHLVIPPPPGLQAISIRANLRAHKRAASASSQAAVLAADGGDQDEGAAAAADGSEDDGGEATDDQDAPLDAAPAVEEKAEEAPAPAVIVAKPAPKLAKASRTAAPAAAAVAVQDVAALQDGAAADDGADAPADDAATDDQDAGEADPDA